MNTTAPTPELEVELWNLISMWKSVEILPFKSEEEREKEAIKRGEEVNSFVRQNFISRSELEGVIESRKRICVHKRYNKNHECNTSLPCAVAANINIELDDLLNHLTQRG